MFDGVEVGALWGSVKFFHTKLIQPRLHGPCFMHWGKIMLRQNCSHNIGSRKSSKNVLGGTKISVHCNYKAQAKVQKENDYAVRPNTFVYIIYACFPPFLPIVIGTVLEVSN